MNEVPQKRPIRASRNGSRRIIIAVRQDIALDGMRVRLRQFGELVDGMDCLHLICDPLYVTDEVIEYLNSYTDEDCRGLGLLHE